MLVEGGSKIHASFLKSNCVTEIALFIAPIIIGGQKPLSWCGDLNVVKLDEAYKFEIISVTSVGEDWLILAKPKSD